MKLFFISISILFAILFVLQIYWLIQSNKLETQKYKVLSKGENYEIRFYPSSIYATVLSKSSSFDGFKNKGFRTLASYIFGSNESNAQISMTSPVHMDFNDSGSSMSFVMPSNFNENNLPKPNDSNIIIKKTENEYVAAIRFGGFASEKDIRRYCDKLENALNSVPITSIGSYRFLGYNPPFQLIGRRNEVIVRVLWDSTHGKPSSP